MNKRNKIRCMRRRRPLYALYARQTLAATPKPRHDVHSKDILKSSGIHIRAHIFSDTHRTAKGDAYRLIHRFGVYNSRSNNRSRRKKYARLLCALTVCITVLTAVAAAAGHRPWHYNKSCRARFASYTLYTGSRVQRGLDFRIPVCIVDHWKLASYNGDRPWDGSCAHEVLQFFFCLVADENIYIEINVEVNYSKNYQKHEKNYDINTLYSLDASNFQSCAYGTYMCVVGQCGHLHEFARPSRAFVVNTIGIRGPVSYRTK
ncbi:unnamed protein product [Trichogramma brassicae]|uniref:Uncharacterized protein n=1 Tax=Trichogramma brassicae TaxID=86971 RepID=A0A6H5IYZ8_9HYME|nr:unnamed protein product [Trichogramma brassicae]